MKVNMLTVLLIASHLIAAKKFDECEFATELYGRHQVPRGDIYKHFCIANKLHTAKDKLNDGISFKGIYAIGSQWWCGLDAPGGGCNVKCSDLLDDDIADDVECANLILSLQGISGWGINEKKCKRSFVQKVDDCLATNDVLIGLIGNVSEISMTPTSVAPTTTVTTTIAQRTTSATPTMTTSLNQNSTSNNHDVTDFQSSPHRTLNAPIECSCATQNILLSIIIVALLGATAAFLFKYRNLKRFLSLVQKKEYEEYLIS